MANYNGDGFTQDENGTVFGTVSKVPGSVDDYDSWDWKKIEAAIVGMAAGTNSSSNLAHAKAVADPASLSRAAEVFHYVHSVLSQVAKSLTDQAKALAGTDGPWKGAAAEAFTAMMETFSKQVAATADVLSGGSLGTHSVYQQLADNALTLQHAQTKIAEIDQWYAEQAQKLGTAPVDGLVPISKRPELVEMMTADMRVVLRNLAGEYAVTIDDIRPPGPVTSPVKEPPKDGTGKDGSGKDGTGKDGTGKDGTGKDGTGKDGTGGSGSGGPKFSAAPPPPPGTHATPKPFPNGLDLGGAKGGKGGSKGGNDGSKGGTGGKLPPLPSLHFPGSTELGTGGSLPPFSLLPFPGSTSLGGLPGTLGLAGLDQALNPRGTGLGLGNGLTSGASTFGRGGLSGGLPGRVSAEGVGRFPGLGGLVSDVPATPGRKPTESENEERPPLETTTLASAGPNAAAAPGAAGMMGGAGMPMMPGMGAGGGQQTPNERSDASGLLDADGKPWAGLPEAGDEVGSELGATAGGAVLELPGAQLATELTAEEAVEAVGTGLGIGVSLGMAAGASAVAGAAGRAAPAERSESAASPNTAGEVWNEPWTGEFDDLDGTGGRPAAVGVPAEGLDLTSVNPVPVSAPEAAPVSTESPQAAQSALPEQPIQPEQPGPAVGSDGRPLPAPDGPDPLAPVPAPTGGEDPGSSADWDVAAASFVPLLWSVPTENEPETVVTGRTREAPSTWAAEDGPDAESLAPDGRQWATWQPSRVDPTGAGVSFAGAVSLSCGEAPPGEESEEDDEPTEQEEEAETTSPGIADLLVQERDAWGSPTFKGPDALG
ncbi:hypothetical protein [Kitasatospora sp. NPDC050543]|uniref:hypothetical protein n=1 Tax=Kitasatospora sp. NPDC050543 TaxID=3364054 RepID=UPI0037A2B26D